ncbi:MAG: integration host factor subunit beta [Candidatus Glassbacteria bacterium]|nr:integration host factor subunit beta [Candidatus Glassbacteria bacterium]
MTKADIVELIAEKTGFTIKDIKVVVEGFIDEVKETLVEGKHIEIRGFGTFKVKKHKARKARNPRTNKEVMVPSRKKAFFKVSKELNKILN